MKSAKRLAPYNSLVSSIKNLRDELMKQPDANVRVIAFKLNSCLFSEYPHKEHTNVQSN